MPAAKGLVSVSKKKESPDQKVGVALKQDIDGVVFIKKIAKSGIFHETELQVDDQVLSINHRRLGANETLDEYIESTLNNPEAEKITIVVRKADSVQSPKKHFERELRRSAGGTLEKPDPEEKDKEQHMVKGIKKKGSQKVGVTFVKVGDKLFVSGISSKSIFHFSKKPKVSAELEFGDRIVAVNDTNFMNYADEKLAEKLLAKSSVMECVLYVEKGWDVLNRSHVDKKHFDPKLERGGKHYPPAAPSLAEDLSDDDAEGLEMWWG